MTIICFGKTADKHIQGLIEHYSKRIKAFIQLEIKELKEQKNTNTAVKLKHEYEQLKSLIPPSSHVFILDEKGKAYSSIKLAQKFESIHLNGKNHICFIIGSAYGFYSEMYEHKDFDFIALSKMTFTHDMVRVFLLEQLYRTEMIARNTGYHH